MFQKEVADRIIAKENTSQFGRLSVLMNWRLNIKKVFDIGPNSFLQNQKLIALSYILLQKMNFKNLKIQKILK